MPAMMSASNIGGRRYRKPSSQVPTPFGAGEGGRAVTIMPERRAGQIGKRSKASRSSVRYGHRRRRDARSSCQLPTVLLADGLSDRSHYNRGGDHAVTRARRSIAITIKARRITSGESSRRVYSDVVVFTARRAVDLWRRYLPVRACRAPAQPTAVPGAGRVHRRGVAYVALPGSVNKPAAPFSPSGRGSHRFSSYVAGVLSGRRCRRDGLFSSVRASITSKQVIAPQRDGGAAAESAGRWRWRTWRSRSQAAGDVQQR